MGLLIASATVQSSIAQKKDLEYKIQLIQDAQMALQSSSKDLINAGSDLDPDSPTYKQLQLRKERLNNLEKKLDMELQEYRAKLEMVEGQMQAAKQMESASIKEIYS